MEKLALTQGSTHSQIVRWGVEPIIYKPITGIAQVAPVRITCVGHNVPAGWPIAIASVKGMKEINAKNVPPKYLDDPYTSDYKQATVEDVDTLTLNLVNAADFSAYQSGGYVQYFTPVDIADFTARMSIKDKKGGTEILSLTTENGGLTIDSVAHTVTIHVTALQTAALTISKGLFDLEMVSPDGVTVTAIMSGPVTVAKEVTT